MSRAIAISVFLSALLTACQSAGRENLRPEVALQPSKRNSGKLIHALVALCDNQYQGIVPVPARIGNWRLRRKRINRTRMTLIGRIDADLFVFIRDDPPYQRHPRSINQYTDPLATARGTVLERYREW